MKCLKFVAIFSLAFFVSLNTVIAQQRLKPSSAQAEYICTRCNFKQYAPGKCPKDNTELSPINTTYVCDTCNISRDTLGNCPKCGRLLKEVKKADGKEVEQFPCRHCGRKLTVVNQSAVCDVCSCGKPAGECR